MAYPAGYSSDEDGINGFLSDDSFDLEVQEAQEGQQLNIPQEISREQHLTNLFFAIMNGNVESVLSILDQGIDVNIDIRDGWTPVLLAASVGDPDIVRHLISRGANVNATRDKLTPLMAVCICPSSTSPSSKCLDVMTLLLAQGATVDAITRNRKTALMFAASNGNLELVEKLLTCCDVKAEDNQGWNALFWAINDNKPEVVQLLLDAGFTLDKVDIRGNTPSFYAISQEHEDVIKILPLPVEVTVTPVYENAYYIDTLFDNKQPQFFRDICYMLYGMKCDQLVNIFTDITLLDFLSINEPKLLQLGVEIPYQRDRILTGLYKYHKHMYKHKSLPIVAKDSIFSTINMADYIIATIRQLISMEASLKYITYFYNDTENMEPFRINIIRNRISKLKKISTLLHSKSQMWDATNGPVDLITSRSNNISRRWIRWFAYLSIISLGSVIINKIQKY